MKTVRHTNVTVKFDCLDLRKLLNLPDDSQIFVTVPGGRDCWANKDLNIDERHHLIVQYTTHEEVES